MKLQGEFVFDGPREAVWELLLDPDALAGALPGTQKLERVAEDEYEGQMDVRIGPVAGLFSGKVVIGDKVAPASYSMTVDGKGAPGFARGNGQVRLAEHSDGKTLMTYEGDVTIGGRLAGVGQRLIDSVSKSMTRQGLETLNEALKARQLAATRGSETSFRPPTETAFAARVARDMAAEVAGSLSFEGQMALLFAGLALLACLVGLLRRARR